MDMPLRSVDLQDPKRKQLDLWQRKSKVSRCRYKHIEESSQHLSLTRKHKLGKIQIWHTTYAAYESIQLKSYWAELVTSMYYVIHWNIWQKYTPNSTNLPGWSWLGPFASLESEQFCCTSHFKLSDFFLSMLDIFQKAKIAISYYVLHKLIPLPKNAVTKLYPTL